MSYVFSGDMNSDGFSGNDLIYIPRDTSEMNFVAVHAHYGTRTFTAAEQAAAFEAYIQQDNYLSKRRGQYAERNGQWMPMFNGVDLSMMQDIFRQHRRQAERRANSLRHHELRQPAEPQLGCEPAPRASDDGGERRADSDEPRGGPSDGPRHLSPRGRQQRAGKGDVPDGHEVSATNSDVYQFLLSFRYSFN